LTINLIGAKELNTQFAFILDHYSELYDEIIVGVINGKPSSLSDKYDILRGINRGKIHNVVDIQTNVTVLSGRDFWSWLNGGEPATQDWVLEGIIRGLQDANCREESRVLLTKYTHAFNRRYAHDLNEDGTVKWHQFLEEVNG
jgi:hypothetical protein